MGPPATAAREGPRGERGAAQLRAGGGHGAAALQGGLRLRAVHPGLGPQSEGSGLGPPRTWCPFTGSFFGEGSPSKINRWQKKVGTLILTFFSGGPSGCSDGTSADVDPGLVNLGLLMWGVFPHFKQGFINLGVNNRRVS